MRLGLSSVRVAACNTDKVCHLPQAEFSNYRGADKSFARPNSQCLRTETVVSLEINLLLRSNNVCLLQTLKNL